MKKVTVGMVAGGAVVPETWHAELVDINGSDVVLEGVTNTVSMGPAAAGTRVLISRHNVAWVMIEDVK